MEPIEIVVLIFIGVGGNVGGSLVGKFTEAVLPKANTLRKKIWDNLKGNPNAEIALQAAENGSQADLEAVADYLKIEMRENPEFGAEVQKLAEEIKQEEIPQQAKNTQNNYDNSTGYQTIIEKGGKAFVGTNNFYQSPESFD